MSASPKNRLRRPSSLAEAAEWSTSFEEFALNVRDFLHHFQGSPAMESLMGSPAPLAARFADGHIADAYLAAMAVELAHSLSQPRPAWTQSPERFCRLPWFASPGRHMRATLLLESPPGFRELVTANVLSVA